MAKSNQGLEHGQNQKLNVEDHIASTPTGPQKNTYPRVGSWYSAANTGLLV
jgi:hypothetical protein